MLDSVHYVPRSSQRQGANEGVRWLLAPFSDTDRLDTGRAPETITLVAIKWLGSASEEEAVPPMYQLVDLTTVELKSVFAVKTLPQ